MVYIGKNAEGVKKTMGHISVKKQQNCITFKIVLFGTKTHKLCSPNMNESGELE